MAPVNIDYSEASENTKKALLKEICSARADFLQVFFHRLQVVNETLKEGNFIPGFQNTAAAKVYQNLSKLYETKKWKEKAKVIEWIANTRHKLKGSGDYGNAKKMKIMTEAAEVTDTLMKSLKTTLDDYFSEHEQFVSLLGHKRCLFEADITITVNQTSKEIMEPINYIFYDANSKEKRQKELFEPRLLMLKEKHTVGESKLTKTQRKNLVKDFNGEWLSFLNGLELEKTTEAYEAEKHPTERQEKSKEKYFYILLSLVEAGSNVKEFCSEITSSIIQSVQRQFESLLRDLLVQECLEFCNCKQMLLQMYIDLYNNGDFHKYKSYLRNFRRYSLRWIRERLVAFLNSTKGNKETHFAKLFRVKAETPLKSFVEVMKNDQLGGVEYKVYLKALQHECGPKSIDVGLSKESLSRLELLPIQDLQKFREDVVAELLCDGKVYMKNLIEKLDVERELNRIKPSMQEQLYNDLMCGEGEQCPFCGAPCSVIGPHDEHKTDMHQPLALKGWTDIETNRLVEKHCPYAISMRNKFINAKTGNQYVSYRNYKNYYPRWYIPGDSNLESTKYWKMVLKKYNQELATWYNAEPADIPEYWKGYQWSVVKKDLQEIYDVKL